MKKLLSLVALATIFSCSNMGTKTTIKFENFEGNYKILSSRVDTLTSSVAKKGEITPLNLKAEKKGEYPKMVYLFLEGEEITGRQPFSMYINEGDNIVVSIKEGNIEVMSETLKSIDMFYESNKDINTLKMDMENIEKEFQTLREEFGAANEEKRKELTAKQNELSKQYTDFSKELSNKIFDIMSKSKKKDLTEALILVNNYSNYLNDFNKAKEILEIAKSYNDNLKLEITKGIVERIEGTISSLEKSEKTKVGANFIDIVTKTVDGKDIKLSDVVAKNKVTLLKFWAQWCGPCIRSIPATKEKFNKFGKKGFTIFAYSIDSEKDKEKWKNKITEEGTEKWINVSDLEGWKSKGAENYGVISIPTEILISNDGKIIGRNLHGEELENKIKEYLMK